MTNIVEVTLVFFALTNIYVLGTDRLSNQIKAIFLQGVALFFFAVFSHMGHITLHVIMLAIVVLAVKGMAIPYLLTRTLSGLSDTAATAGPPRSIKDEFSVFSQPHVGFGFSITLGMIFIGVSFWIGSKINYLSSFPSYASFAIPVAIATVFSGLIIVVGRMQALTQAIGYLIMENGVFTYGISLSAGVPLMVEVGILLDVLGSVMIMGIALFHINKSFARIDVHAGQEGGGHG
ncbi:MAG: hypothetical protein ACE5GQ_00365 [Nitrospinales bacterium]